MLKNFVALFLILAFSGSVLAYDLSRKIGIGVIGNYAIPVFGNDLNTVAGPDLGYGALIRYHRDPFFGIELDLTRSEFSDTDIYFNNINLLGFWRFRGASEFTPVVGFGLGLTKIKYWVPKSAKLSLLGRAGVDYALNNCLSLAALAEYQYVSNFLGKMSSPAQVITPQIALTYYFDVQK
ncbi:MAG: outer membrane beta-barrel protein [Bacteriovorax sp.]|nr:outer membrane beta-barrel protein [Bacteriovorax sp.]